MIVFTQQPYNLYLFKYQQNAKSKYLKYRYFYYKQYKYLIFSFL
jgi:hypothetical protein